MQKSRFLLATALATSAPILLAQPAWAQEAAPQAAEDEAAADEIIVTGTLISNPNLVASTPVNVTTAEEITLRQTNVAEDILRQIPGVVPNIGSAVNNGNGGASFVDLRGLGSNRNIVLLDGARITPSNTVGRVDLNNIPLALVERVDALTGGASTTYGADAISGVVNFVTKKNFSGVELSVGNAITEEGDGNYFRTDLTIGANLDDGRGNVVLGIGYQQADPVSQGARPVSSTQYSSQSGRPAGSVTTVPAVIVLGGALTQVDPATGTLVPVFQQFNFNPFNVFQTPFERFNIYGAGNYEVADGIEVYARALFSKNNVKAIVAPSGIFDEVLTIPISNPFLPLGVRNQLCADQGISAAACTAAAAETDPTQPNFLTLDVETLRRLPEIGSRIQDFQTTVFDYRAGVRGNITDRIKFDVAGSYGESTNLNTTKKFALLSRITQAVNATNATTCIDPSNNCVPLNIFGGPGSITPAQAAFLSADSTTNNKTSLSQVRGLVNGDFGTTSPFASDPIGFAVGAEYRKYQASQAADLLAKTPGELQGAGGAAPDINGGYDVYEGFGELIAPLVQDRPFFENLTFEAGVRYSHYKIFTPTSPTFNTTTYKFGGSWQPIKDVKFRGVYQHSLRAPNINELFAPVTTGLTNLAVDPCAGAAPVGNANLAAICLAQGAPAAAVANGTIAQPSAGQANATGGGNPNLGPETSNSYTFGVVLQPSILPGLSVTVDYYNIKVRGAVSFPTPGDIISACFGNITAASATSAACTGIRRNPGTGQLSGSVVTTPGLPQPLSNLGRLATDGVDLTVNYKRDLGFADLSLNFTGNYTASSKFQATPSGVNRECTGFFSANCASIQPEFSFNQRTTLSFGNIDASLLWRHISPVKFEPGLAPLFSGNLSGGPLNGQTVNFNRIPAFDYFDLATRFKVNDNVELVLTASNIFDRKPPVVGNTAGSTTFNSGNTYPSTYDALGRRYAVSAKLKF
jgi:outer membrane receptor protein involved in Fe transport